MNADEVISYQNHECEIFSQHHFQHSSKIIRSFVFINVGINVGIKLYYYLTY